ncbi:hypothetical protein FE257_012577 [Aspergillus nanangensis]|uniref:F-box domain-containing protein n=1 Tax=Aspergillus nanangensis TaxID=2582783 RepID=A0AAD4CUV5_ASPNN|nr:hypothetical protein FE257_012577 [Aspergillus nanangensis]
MKRSVLQEARASSTSSRREKKPDTKRYTLSKHRAVPSSGSTISVVDRSNLLPTSSSWDVLPVELQIKIFANCGVKDVLLLKLVCRAFSQLISSNEHSIARQYLRQRRHGTLPSEVDSERTYSSNPADDVVILSDLFPPSKSAKGGFIYTFRYIHSLRRRQSLCSKLAYYMADRVMDRFVHDESAYVKSMFSSRNERNEFRNRTIARISFHIMPLMYYTLYFLESYSSARRELTHRLVRDFEEKRLPVRIQPHDRKTMYQQLQMEILRSPPFTDNSTLISTHHCMQLLVSYMRYTVPPDEQFPQDDSWIGSLLTVSPFLRIVEYFSAEIGDGGSQRLQRKQFMQNFHHDIKVNEKDDMDAIVFNRVPNAHLHPSVHDVWFDVARQEIVSRKLGGHDAELIVASHGLPVLFSCDDCRVYEGWHAS